MTLGGSTGSNHHRLDRGPTFHFLREEKGQMSISSVYMIALTLNAVVDFELRYSDAIRVVSTKGSKR